MTEEQDIDKRMKEIVIMRLESLPSDLRLSIGDEGNLSKEEMIEHVKNGDKTGKMIVQTHISFLKAIVNGELTKAMTSV